MDPDLIVETRTLAELLTAIEGYRNQLSVFSDTALIEIEMLQNWVRLQIAQGTPKVGLLSKVP
jgi:hypothetical protein